MKPEDVDADLVEAMLRAIPDVQLRSSDARHALAAVIPLVVAAEREACAGVVEAEKALLVRYRDVFERMGNDDAVRARQPEIETLGRLAVAIRARNTP